jgi:hypothetical protein
VSIGPVTIVDSIGVAIRGVPVPSSYRLDAASRRALLRSADDAGDAAGRSSGRRFGRRFGGSAGDDASRALRGQAPKIAGAADVAGQQAGSKFGSGFKRLATAGLAAVGTVLAARTVRYVRDAITNASDLSETINKTNVVFGRNAAQVQRWSKTSATSFGISRQAALTAVSTFGEMFRQLGFTGAESARTSQKLVKTAADLGSFHNVDPTDVLDRIGASLRGEYDSLQQLIPNINAARVAQEAMRATGKKSAADLTAQEKATATLAIITRDGANANNDYAETSRGLANQQRQATAGMADLSGVIGEQLLPVQLAATRLFNDEILPALTAFATEQGPRAAAMFGRVADGIRGMFGSGNSAGRAKLATEFASIGDSLGDLGPVVQDLRESMPSLLDVLSVGGTILRVLADHADLLAASIPFLVAGLVAFRVAQAAANVAAAVSVPLRILEMLANRRLAASNAALAATIAANTTATLGNVGATVASTTATNVNAGASVRQRVAVLASAVAQRVARGAALAWAGATWLLNAAMAANPLGLVIAAVALLTAGFVLAYRRSETFRRLVDGAFRGVAAAGRWMWEQVLAPALTKLRMAFITVQERAALWRAAMIGVWRAVQEAFRLSIRWIITNFTSFASRILDTAANVLDAIGMDGLAAKLRGAAGSLRRFRDDANRALSGVRDQNVRVLAEVTARGLRPGFLSGRVDYFGNPIKRRAGGPIGHGYGGGDRVHVLGEAGEHVLSKEDVRAIGGQAAVLEWRRRLHGGVPLRLSPPGPDGIQRLRTGGPIMDMAMDVPSSGQLAREMQLLAYAVRGLTRVVGQDIATRISRTRLPIGDARIVGSPRPTARMQRAADLIIGAVGNNFASLGTYPSGDRSPGSHGSGRGVDFMVPGGGRSSFGISLGTRAYSWAARNHAMLGLAYMIWRDRITSGRNGWSLPGRRYSNPYGRLDWTGRHMDHIHVGVMGAGGITTRPTHALLSERRQTEVVLPLDKPRRTLELLRAAGLAVPGQRTNIGTVVEQHLHVAGVDPDVVAHRVAMATAQTLLSGAVAPVLAGRR